jgi:hypothetical protein
MDALISGETNVPVEIELRAQVRREASADLDVEVAVSGPDGTRWRIPAFRAGERTFRARFAAPMPGQYSWRCVCSGADADLAGQEGRLEVRPYTGANPLFRHGRLRVAASGRSFEHADGTPFLWLGDTWWMGLTTRLDWPQGFRTLAEDRARKGFSAIQIVAGPLPDFDADTHTWTRQQANEAGWSWLERPGRDPLAPPTPQDFMDINPAFYDLADLRVACLIEAGLMPCLVGMWGYYLPYLGLDKVKRHWRNLVARYAAYPVTWCLCGETTMANYGCREPEARARRAEEQKAGWSAVAAYLRSLDPFHNLISTHPSCPKSSRDEVTDCSLLDFDMLQTGHSAHESYRNTLRLVTESRRTDPPRPFFNSEVNYEGIMGGNWHEVQRFLFWTNLLGGACGHTYGAQGIWNMNSRNDPFRGTTFDWGEGFWQDVMHYPGSAHLGLAATFLRQYPWQDFEPRPEPLPEGCLYAHAAGIRGRVAMYYFPVEYTLQAFKGLRGRPVTIFPGEAFEASWFNPRSGALTSVGPVTPDQNGRWLPVGMPDRADWVLLLENPAAPCKDPRR